MIAARLLLILAGMFALGASAFAQPTVLVLSSEDSPVYRQVAASFTAFLHDEVGQLEFVSVTLQDDDAKRQEQLTELAKQKLAMVFALGSQATRLAAERFPAVSIVSSMVLSLTEFRSQRNVTGVALDFPPATQLQWMRRLLPKVNRIGVLFDPALNQAFVDAARLAAERMGLELLPIPVRHPRELPAGLKELDREADLLWAIPDNTVYSSSTLKQVLLSSFRSRVPLVGLSDAWVKAGALYALDRDYQSLGRQSGAIAKKLLAGVSPGKVVPETPLKVIYSINRKTAGHMKLEIDNDVLASAAKVYK